MQHWSLYQGHFSTAEMDSVWSEHSMLSAWLQQEQVLADCQADLGIIPRQAADALMAVSVSQLDPQEMAAQMRLVGRPIVGLVKQLRRLVGENLASYVHFGATTQDIIDSATMCRMRDGLLLISASSERLIQRLEQLSSESGKLEVIARTNGQYALPITLAQRFKAWQQELIRRKQRIDQCITDNIWLQLGGPVGDGRSFGDQSQQLKVRMADKLQLKLVEPHWQNTRDGVAEIISALGILCSSVGKIAQNINLLSSSDIAELYESADPGQGASSSMAHKQNQRCSEFAEAVARLGRQQAEQINETSQHQHERSGGAWISEWIVVANVFLYTSGALSWSEKLFDNLKIDENRVRQNLQAYHCSINFG